MSFACICIPFVLIVEFEGIKTKTTDSSAGMGKIPLPKIKIIMNE
jgi:hypothetical protein